MSNGLCAILGSGFGLYGYLPAMVQKMHRILLPKRYQPTFMARTELARFIPDVEFVRDEMDAVKKAEICVIAKRPQDQEYWVDRILESGSAKQVILEKPLAPTPQGSLRLLKKLCSDKFCVRIGYSFLYTGWGQALAALLRDGPACGISLDWQFHAHHFENNLDTWKRFDSQGGGALRFYGIQVIAVLAAAKSWHIRSSELYQTGNDETCRWNALLEPEKGGTVRVCVDSCSPQSHFICRQTDRDGFENIMCDDFSPFKAVTNNQDPRVSILCKLIDSFGSHEPACSIYKRSIALWNEIEQNSTIRRIKR